MKFLFKYDAFSKILYNPKHAFNIYLVQIWMKLEIY